MAAANAMIPELPTLLTSRRARLSCVGAEGQLAKECSKKQSAEMALEGPELPLEDPAERRRAEARPARRLPEAYAMPICVRNTFIDTSAECSPSLGRFYREREVSTCPSAHIGRFSRLLEAGAGGWEIEGDLDALPSSGAQETWSAAEAPPANVARAGPGSILSLAEALSPPARPVQPASSWDGGRLAVGSALAGPAGAPPEAPRDGPFGGDCRAPWGELGAPMAERAAAAGFFVPVPCDRAFGDWRPSWPPRGAAADYCFVACGAAAAPCDAGLAGRAAADGAAPRPPAAVAEAPPPAVPAPPTQPAPGSEELPSVGSAAHSAGGCKPCAFFYTVGCESGPGCLFCHLCGPDERKLRRKTKAEARRADKLRKAGRQGAAAATHHTPEEEDLGGAM